MYEYAFVIVVDVVVVVVVADFVECALKRYFVPCRYLDVL